MKTLQRAPVMHPHHPHIAQAIRNWFHAPMDSMGLRSVVRQWGTYWDHGDVHLSGLSATELPSFLADLDSLYPRHRRTTLVIDRAETACDLDAPLRQHGWRREVDRAFLTHVGAFPGYAPVVGLAIFPADEENLMDFARARLMSFSVVDQEPAPSRLMQEVARLRGEMAGTGRGCIASLCGQAAGALWSYEEDRDVWISLLGVRAPFRRRGIAHALLKERIGAAYSRGIRSVTINVAVDNEAALRLYHKLGFCQESYRQVRYSKNRET